MGSTNYLATGADLSDAMIKEQDAQIADTEEFFNQMAELEKQRAERPLKLLGEIADFAQSAAPVLKQIQQANDDRNRYKGTLDRYKGAKSDLDDDLLIEQNEIEASEKQTRKEEQEFSENAKKDATDPTKTREEREIASDASAIFGQGSFTYQDGLNSRNNLKEFDKNLGSYFQSATKYDGFAAIDNRVLKDATTTDEFNELFDFYTGVIFQNQIRARRDQGLRDATDGEILKYVAPEVYKQRQKLYNEWKEGRQALLDQAQVIRDNDEVSSMFQNKATLANDVLGKEGWITSKKAQLEARGLDASSASQLAFDGFGDIVEPMLDDVGSGVDAGDVRILLDQVFEFPGGAMRMDDERAPKGAQRLHARLTAAANKYDEEAIERENETTKLEMGKWEETNHVEFEAKIAKMTDPRKIADEVDTYVLDFRKRFNITDDEALPEFMKNFITSREFADEAIVTEIRSRRRNNLPITQSMIDKIADPDIRDEQSKYVNTPELGAFTDEEAESMEEIAIAIVKEGKTLTDLRVAKSPKYIFARDAAKAYVTERFKELVVGGTPRQTAMDNAIDEAIVKMRKGIFDNRKVAPIDTQNTLDLQSTLNALGKDPSLIYSTEEWAGEAPHLAIAREYIRTGGRSRYPSYYMRFNFIKNADGEYLTPEEIFETRVEKVDVKEKSKQELPERKELDNVDDKNKLLNKTNGTKVLDVATKNNNIEWMIKTKPSVSELNAEMFIRQLETNIQRQQFIGGVSIPHKQKTTLSKEDNDKLLEAVPELKEAPFLNPNTLSTAAINEMLNLNI
tara:strand:- start:993 stop:3377 length:2385 start_codon:yes stop_codon:yes gene_type:complete